MKVRVLDIEQPLLHHGWQVLNEEIIRKSEKMLWEQQAGRA